MMDRNVQAGYSDQFLNSSCQMNHLYQTAMVKVPSAVALLDLERRSINHQVDQGPDTKLKR